MNIFRHETVVGHGASQEVPQPVRRVGRVEHEIRQVIQQHIEAVLVVGADEASAVQVAE